MKGCKFILLSILLVFSSLCIAVSGKPNVYEDNYGNIYIQAEKQTIIIASDVTIPLHIYPSNGLLKLEYVDGRWRSINITEDHWLTIRDTLTLSPSLEDRLRWQDINGDGIEDLTLFTDSNSNYPSSVISVSRSNLKTYSINIPSDSNLNDDYFLVDINGDGYLDIKSNSGVFLGRSSGGFIYTSAQLDEPATTIALTSGQFNVDETGQATYQIPIYLPKGPGGIKPSVSINYSSAAGPGNAGFGWNVSATSAIVRCNKNFATDSVQKAVRFDSTDGFCIDGQRLLLRSGIYGANGSKYSTELADFSVIEAIGQDPSTGGPKGFKVYTKDGDIKYYGDTNLASDSDAFITPAPNKRQSAHTWMLKQVSDVYNNKITYSYDTNKSTGENTLSEINYGQVNVKLNYIQSNTKQYGFQYGGLVASTKRIEGIEVTRGGESLRFYSINSDNSDKDYIDSIQECTSNSGDKSCKPSTKFSYHKNNASTSFDITDNLNSQLRTTTLFADFNGDGKSDLVYTNKLGTTLTVKITDGDTDVITTSLTKASAFKLTDFNGDGYTDILYAANNKWYAKAYQPAQVRREDLDCEDLYQQQEPQYQRQREPCTPFQYTESLSFSNGLDLGISYTTVDTPMVDVNGDGLQDWIILQGKSVKFKANIESDNTIGRAFNTDASSLYTFVTSDFPENNPACPINTKRLQTSYTKSADINGDGISDFILKLSNIARSTSNIHPYCNGAGDTHEYKLLLSKASNDYQKVNLDMNETNNLRFVDLNADGLTDLAYIKSNKWKYRLSTGDPTTPLLSEVDFPTIPSSLTEANFKGNVHFADINRDNITDIVALDKKQVLVSAGYCKRKANGGLEPYSINQVSEQTVQSGGQWRCLDNEIWVEPVYASGSQLKYWLGSRSSATALSYAPISLERDGQAGTSHTVKVADINGDGLVDILKSSSKLDVNAVWTVYENSQYDSSIAVNKMHTIENGFGVKTQISYKPIDDNTVYEHLPAFNTLGKVNADFYSPKTGMWLVNKVESDSNVTPSSIEKVAVEYKYAGMKIHKKGRGPQGFYQVTSKDLQTNITTTTQYHQAWPLTGRPAWTKAYAGDELITEAVSTWKTQITAQGNTHVYLESNSEQGWQIGTDGARRFTGRKVTTNQYDNGYTFKWGNLTRTELKTYSTPSGESGGLVHQTTNVNTYFSQADYLRFGRLKSSTVEQRQFATTEGQEASTLQRQTEFTYYDNLMLHTETVAGNCDSVVSYTSRSSSNHCDISNQYTKAYEYDGFGNTSTVSITSGGETRSTTTNYDTTGEFVVSKTNALGHTESYLYNGQQSPRGVIYSTTQTGPNGIATTTRINTWGEAYQTIYADSNEKNISTKLCSSSSLCADINGYYYTSISQSGMPTSYSVYDKFGRNVRNTRVLVDGSTVYEDIIYDKQNNPIKKSLPYKVGESVKYTSFEYDTYNRLKRTELPYGKVTAVSYKGRVTTTTDYGGTYNNVYRSTFYRDEKSDWLGRTLYATDPYKSQSDETSRVLFSYNAFGDVVKTTNKVFDTDTQSFVETTTQTFYDRYGRKIKVSDPTKGTWKTYYNGFNEITREINARGETTYNLYDVLGRLIRSQQLDKANNGTLVNCHVHGTSKSDKNIGKLTNSYQYRVINANAGKSCDDLKAQHAPTISKTFSFDEFARPKQQTIVNAGGTFSTVTSYNSYGQPSSIGLPNGMIVNTHYKNGQPFSTYNSLTGMLLSRIDEVNAQGQITEQTLAGNVKRGQTFDDNAGFITGISVQNSQQTLYSVSYEHDIRGSTTERNSYYYEPGYANDSIQFAEEFNYEDNGLQRLTGRTVTNTVTRYNTSVRLQNQTYTYDAYGNIKTNSNVGTYHYSNTANPYELTSITGGSGKRSYAMQYDNHGNIYNDGQRRFYYTQFDKPYKIKNANTYTEFKYDEQGSRYYRKDLRSVNGAQQTKQTYYVGKVYELTRRSGGRDAQGSLLPDQVEHRWYIAGVVLSQIEGQAQKVQVAHTDMLGSTVLITDEHGKGIGQYIYDPWGKQQQVYTRQDLTASSMLLSQMRSFTGHEQMDELNVIHMNGRIYDASIGRFLQADPFIQFPKLTQSHNRYSYVLNNPLTYNDPSGYFLKKLMKVTGLTSILKAIASIPILDAAVSIVLNFIPGCQVWCAALYQGLKTYAVTGDFGAGLKAGIITAMTAAVSAEIGSNLDFELGGWTAVQNVASHAMVGGVSAVLQGGKFGHGFVSSLVTASMKGFMNPKTTSFGNAYSRTAIAGVVGGTVSKLTGGKFANGAVTSAMQWWYNAEKGGLVEKAKENARALREHISNLDKNDRVDRAKIAALSKQFGFLKGTGEQIIRSSKFASLYKQAIYDSLNDVVVAEAMPYVMNIVEGNNTLIGDPLATISSAVGPAAPQAGWLGQARGILGVWGATLTADQYYNKSNSFMETINEIEMSYIRDIAPKCGETMRCW